MHHYTLNQWKCFWGIKITWNAFVKIINPKLFLESNIKKLFLFAKLKKLLILPKVQWKNEKKKIVQWKKFLLSRLKYKKKKMIERGQAAVNCKRYEQCVPPNIVFSSEINKRGAGLCHNLTFCWLICQCLDILGS